MDELARHEIPYGQIQDVEDAEHGGHDQHTTADECHDDQHLQDYLHERTAQIDVAAAIAHHQLLEHGVEWSKRTAHTQQLQQRHAVDPLVGT